MVEEDSVDVSGAHRLALDVVPDALEGRHGADVEAQLLAQVVLEAVWGDDEAESLPSDDHGGGGAAHFLRGHADEHDRLVGPVGRRAV